LQQRGVWIAGPCFFSANRADPWRALAFAPGQRHDSIDSSLTTARLSRRTLIPAAGCRNAEGQIFAETIAVHIGDAASSCE
jgi:hypothetical protein